jgi:hypothetical protein
MSGTTDGYCPGFGTKSCSPTEGRIVSRSYSFGRKTMKQPSIAVLYHILRVHPQFPVLQSFVARYCSRAKFRS